MKRNKIIITVFLVWCLVFGNVISVSAAPTAVSVYHLHSDEACGKTDSTEYRESVINGNLRTVRTDTCSCGGHLDYYQFDCTCTCGASWHTTGHACINSPAGSYQGSCGNYSRINCSTWHNHPTTTYACGLTTTSEVATLEISISTEEPAQEVELEAIINSTATISNLSYAWSDASTLKTLTVNANDTYTVTITGDNIATTTASITVSNIDATPPTIVSLEADITIPTAGNVTLTVNGTDESGLATEPYSWDGSTWSATNTKTITANGTYTAYVKDSVGNVSQESITISNIDKTAPDITLVADVTEPTPGDVVLTAEGTDAFGLATEPYSWDGSTWSATNTKTITANGTYTVYVKDAVGNIAEKSITISNIYVPAPPADTTPPIILDLYPDTTEPAQQVILTVSVAEPGVLISWDGGLTWGSSTTTIAQANALHTVYVKDYAGNVASRSYDVTNIYIPAKEDEISEIEVIEVEEVKPEEPEEEPEVDIILPPEEEPEEIPEIYVEEVKVPTEKIQGSLSFGEIMTVAAPVAGGGCCLFFFGFWFWGKNAVLFALDGLQERKIGRLKIKKSGGKFIVRIPASMLKKASSNQLCLVPNKRFLKNNEGMYLTIQFANTEIGSRIEREIRIEV